MVSRRKVKKAEKMQAKNQDMSLNEAYKILDNSPSLVSKSVYEQALKVVEIDDAGFAAEIRAFNNQQKKEDALRAAYQIVGGYKNTVSKNLYANAMKLVEADDPDFAQKLQALFENGTTFKDATDEQLATAEQIIQNVLTIEHEYNNDAQLKEEVFNDDVRQAVNNTIVPDISEEDKNNILLKTGQQEAITEIVEDVNFAQAEPKEKHNMLVSRIRDSIKRTLFRARLSSGAKPRDAIDFSKKIKVTTRSITNAFETAYKRASSFISRLSQKGHKKAAALLNRTSFKVILSSAAMICASTSLTNCDTAQNHPTEHAPQPQKTVVLNDTTKTSAAVVSDTIQATTDSIPSATLQAAAADSISVPTEWNENMGITSAQWNRLQTFWGSRAKFETFYNKITNDMLVQDGIFANKTREQVLFQYERLSSWNLHQHRETIEAFDAFFGDCGGVITKEQASQLDDVLSDGSIRNVIGTLNTRVTGREVDCEEGSSLQVQNLDKKENIPSKPDFTFEEEGGSSIVVDENNTSFSFSETGSSRTVLEVKNDTIAPTVQIFKGNTLDDGKQIGTMDADKIVNRTVSDKKDILVEDKDVSSQTTVSATDSLTASPTFAEETGTSKIVFTDAAIAADSVQIKGVSSRATVSATDSLTASPTFAEETGTSKVVFTDSNATTETDSVQIVADSEDLPRGTPAAGNVSERGGYENSGLISKRQDTNLQNWYLTKYGYNAFEDVMEKITDDMLAKGGAFEGLSQKQALRVAEALLVHAHLFPESAEALEAFLNPCKDAQLTVEQIEQIRKDGYNITEEGLVTDGVYNKCVYARFYKTGDCEEDGHVIYERTPEKPSTTVASNRYFGRLYLNKPTRTEPIVCTIREELGTSRTEIQYVYKETEPTVTLHKGNNLNIEESKNLGEISATEVANRKVKEKKNILVEQKTDSSTFTIEEEQGSSQLITSKADKKAEKKAKKAQRQAQRAAEKAKKQQQKIEAEKRREALKKYAGGSDFVHDETLKALGIGKYAGNRR